MAEKLYLINAFAKEKFKGNPAAVLMMNEGRSEDWMMRMAAEMNQPITTFVERKTDTEFKLRWLTPKSEVDLCGHGSLGAAHVIFSEGLVPRDQAITFSTLSGELTAVSSEKGISLTFDIKATEEIAVSENLKAMTEAAIQGAAWAGDRTLIELPDVEDVRRFQPDLDKIAALEGSGLIITARGDGAYDFVSRYFAPKIGVAEDAVTGSAHCALTDYWSKKTGAAEFSVYQASPRGGELHLKKSGDKVEISGPCLILARGELV